MELFLPNAVVYEDGKIDNPKKPVIGYYVLDLEKLGKGKPLEPVKVWRDEKAKVLVVDQYTRGIRQRVCRSTAVLSISTTVRRGCAVQAVRLHERGRVGRISAAAAGTGKLRAN